MTFFWCNLKPKRTRDRLHDPGSKVGDYAISLAVIGIIEEFFAIPWL